jgi:hypothetical protein
MDDVRLASGDATLDSIDDLNDRIGQYNTNNERNALIFEVYNPLCFG